MILFKVSYRRNMKNSKLKRVLNVLDRTEEMTIIGMFAVMVIVIFLQVIMRKVFNNSLTWSEELGKFLFVWITWLGISLGERKGEHIKITMLTDRLPFRAAQIANIISEIIVIAICAVTFYYGVTLVFSQMGTHYAGIKISVSWGYLAVVVGCGLMILRSLWGLSQSVMYMIKGAPTEEVSAQTTEKGGEDA